MHALLGAAISDNNVDAVVLIGSGRTFVAGADITEFVRTGTGPFLPPVLDLMENSPKPVIAAMHGNALGGGLEIAMAAHYRIGTSDLQVGQPEVNLGIIPGAQGTQRLPRLVGMAKAVEMCVTGAPIKVAEAVQAGLVDRIAEGDLEAAAVAFALEAASNEGPHPKTSRRSDKAGIAGRECGNIRGRQGDRPQDSKKSNRAAESNCGTGGRGHIAVRRRLRPRKRAVCRMHGRRTIEGAHARLSR